MNQKYPNEPEETTALDIAVYMKSELEKVKYLYQVDIVYKIEEKYGSKFVYENASGNMSINKEVLKEFQHISPDVVWERSERCWRFREDYDEKNKRGQY